MLLAIHTCLLPAGLELNPSNNHQPSSLQQRVTKVMEWYGTIWSTIQDPRYGYRCSSDVASSWGGGWGNHNSKRRSMWKERPREKVPKFSFYSHVTLPQLLSTFGLVTPYGLLHHRLVILLHSNKPKVTWPFSTDMSNSVFSLWEQFPVSVALYGASYLHYQNTPWAAVIKRRHSHASVGMNR